MDRSREMIENLRKENKEAIKSKKVLSDQMKEELQRQRKAIRDEIEGVADILIQAREKRLSVMRESQVREQVIEAVKQRKEALRAAELARQEELLRQREFAEQQRALQEQQLLQQQLQLQEDERQQRLFRARAEQLRREREENLSAFLLRQQEAQLQQQQQQQQQEQLLLQQQHQDLRLRRAREMQRSHAQLVEHELQRQTLRQAAQESSVPSPSSPSVPEAPPSRQVIAWYQRFTDNYRMRQLQDRALRLKGAVFDT